MQYNAERFNSTFKKETGAAIWEFLTERENIIRMETATYLSRPAIEPMSPLLVQRFGHKISNDRIKQMMGHMVRQIMEQRGYRLQQGNVKITSDENIFSRASRYIAVPEVTK
ncbi:hypothetical protein [Pseudovibrio sp. Ad37]|uniref:hypothetical protein n=1 Tax=Pseudovibrio sp. Ad37 TaxID=989422 RepID=UPI0007AE750A|nr:hypothetical protein [Pseudovibrio sp. Ad37]KZL15713.1 hypothetical protein PsAD37_04290 [Pseudovibrio sp. Ad37]